MKEIRGDLWTVPADIRCILTNGETTKHGAAIMGRGCALQAKQLFPGIEYRLGKLILERGSYVHDINGYDDPRFGTLLSFPTKYRWKEKADLDLIERSCIELHWYWERRSSGTLRVILPRPGCGNGGLSWVDVRPILLRHLPEEQFMVVTYER